MATTDHDWTKPAAMAIPKEGYFELERGRYGPIFPRTPACYGFSIIAKVKEGREEAVRAYGKQIEEAIAASSGRAWRRCSCTTCAGCSSTSAPACTSSTRASSTPTSTSTPRTRSACSARPASPPCSPISKGFPEDWKRTRRRSSSSSASTSCPSFLEYGEYPYVTADEIKKALRLKAAFSDMLDQMQ